MSKIDLNKFKDVVEQFKTKQKHLQGLLSKETLKEAKKYAEISGKELKNLIQTTDVKKVKAYIEKEAKELQKLQKQLPGELLKLSKFVETQKKEFEKILKSVSASDAAEYLQSKVTGKPVKKKTTVAGKKSKKPRAANASSNASTEANAETSSTEE